MNPKCHICGNLTDEDYICQRCGEYVCEDCWVPVTYHNQCTETRCQSCEDMSEIAHWEEIDREEKRKKERKIAEEKKATIDKLKIQFNLDIVLD